MEIKNPIKKYFPGFIFVIINPRITVNIGDNALIILTFEAAVYSNAIF